MSKEYRRVFQSDPELLPEIEDYILNVVSEYDLDEEQTNNVELAVAEAAANCILHGNKSDKSKNVTITITVNSAFLIMSFQDEGDGFLPEKIPDPTIPENILKGSGRGLHIMRTLAEDVSYNFNGKGTELKLKFKL